MTKRFKFLALCFTALAVVLVSSCSNEDDFLNQEPQGVDTNTRAVENPDGSWTITFDDFESYMLAAPTSKGENYYSYLAPGQQVIEIFDPNYVFVSNLNTVGGYQDLSSGGIAVSNWNYRSNITGKTGDWWYSWDNQMSVYNTNSTDGANTNAGHSGSNFGVVYGYSDEYNQAYMAKPEFYLDDERTLVGLWICNTSYTYGIIENGNKFGKEGVAIPLKDTKGYFQVMLECYDYSENLITTKTYMIADYRDGHTQVDPATSWVYWPINVDGVGIVKFNFTGSDIGDYGLNTPAFLCIDDINIK